MPKSLKAEINSSKSTVPELVLFMFFRCIPFLFCFEGKNELIYKLFKYYILDYNISFLILYNIALYI